MGFWSLMWLFAGTASLLDARVSVTISPSMPAPAPVGTMISWVANASADSSGTLWYRFRAREAGQDYRTIRDYGPLNTLDWTASDHEGVYQVEVSVRNRDSGETGTADALFQMTSRVTGSDPVISATSHPLVFLYSAPPCPA